MRLPARIVAERFLSIVAILPRKHVWPDCHRYTRSPRRNCVAALPGWSGTQPAFWSRMVHPGRTCSINLSSANIRQTSSLVLSVEMIDRGAATQ